MSVLITSDVRTQAVLEWLGSPEAVDLLVQAVADNFPDPDSPMVTNEWACEIYLAMERALEAKRR